MPMRHRTKRRERHYGSGPRASKLTKFVVRKVAAKNTDNTLFSNDFHLIPEVQKVVKKQVNRMLFQMS